MRRAEPSDGGMRLVLQPLISLLATEHRALNIHMHGHEASIAPPSAAQLLPRLTRPGSGFIPLDDAVDATAFLAEHPKRKKSVTFVLFTSSKCRGCRALQPKFERMALRYDSDVTFCQVMTDNKQMKEWARREAVQTTPSVNLYTDELVCASGQNAAHGIVCASSVACGPLGTGRGWGGVEEVESQLDALLRAKQQQKDASEQHSPDIDACDVNVLYREDATPILGASLAENPSFSYVIGALLSCGMASRLGDLIFDFDVMADFSP